MNSQLFVGLEYLRWTLRSARLSSLARRGDEDDARLDLVRSHLPPLQRREVCRQAELEYRLAGRAVQQRLAPFTQDVDQVAGAVDETVVPLETLHRYLAGLTNAKEHQRGQVQRAGRATVDQGDAFFAITR